MRLLWLLTWLALVASANSFTFGPANSPLLKKRKSVRPKCGPKFAARGSSNYDKRSVGFIRFERNVSTANLGKRMNLPGTDMGDFYFHEFPRLTERIVPHDTAPVAEDMTTGIMRTFSSIRVPQQYSTGAEGLEGCTVLYIISRKAVYGVHWFENVSFDPDPEWLEGTNEHELFQTTVIDTLIHGGRYLPKLNARRIDDEYIHAYMIRPNETHDELPGYVDEWRRIEATVGDIIPRLKEKKRWHYFDYNASQPMNPQNERETAGRNLFKYDSAHPIGGGQTQKLAKLWMEGNPKANHSDIW
ncbi:hypothetical protein P170DRAFT_477479 [Aspergillus steynii IBT 23096]|uniref:Uncharacterized protein n=1 Tax=Aspergillus steynii IBT 23096 TaxID=1392250 RepID=A0A2I2G149_9EURO|nr:uncharacterized protein P170DRAFT_477479 [Aspergillus steynii IBT 23096]PLB46598.1 hypothetical protein P170DRAFT_477479 [Aspergillus steynii IBT 23096]